MQGKVQVYQIILPSPRPMTQRWVGHGAAPLFVQLACATKMLLPLTVMADDIIIQSIVQESNILYSSDM